MTNRTQASIVAGIIVAAVCYLGFLAIWSNDPQSSAQKEFTQDYTEVNSSKNAARPPLQETGEGAPDIDSAAETATDYFPIDDTVLPSLINKISVTSTPTISSAQEEALRSYLIQLVSAYNHGDADKVLATVLKADYSILPEALAWQKDVLKRYLSPGEKVPEAPLDILKALVDRNYGGHGGSGYRGLFTALSLATSKIKFASTSITPMPLYDQDNLLWKNKINRFPHGDVSVIPSIEYKNSGQTILRDNGRLDYADVTLAATDVDGHKYSRLIRFYWSPPDKTWLLMEVVCRFGNERKADMFF